MANVSHTLNHLIPLGQPYGHSNRLAELIEAARRGTAANDALSVKQWLYDAENAQTQGHRALERAEFEKAFIHIAKAFIIIAQRIPEHPGYHTALNTGQAHKLDRHADDLLHAIKEIRTTLRGQASGANHVLRLASARPLPLPPDLLSPPSLSSRRHSIPSGTRNACIDTSEMATASQNATIGSTSSTLMEEYDPDLPIQQDVGSITPSIFTRPSVLRSSPHGRHYHDDDLQGDRASYSSESTAGSSENSYVIVDVGIPERRDERRVRVLLEEARERAQRVIANRREPVRPLARRPPPFAVTREKQQHRRANCFRTMLAPIEPGGINLDAAREDTSPGSRTIQHILNGCIVTFGAGLDIIGYITGFECCSLRISNLPADALDREIRALFTQQGIDAARFILLSTRFTPKSTKEVTVLIDTETAHALALGLNGLEFREHQLVFEAGTYNTGKMVSTTLATTAESSQTTKPSLDKRSNRTNLPCPICLDEVTLPFQLDCGHNYCTHCLSHLLLCAADTDIFPLSCIGNEGRCGMPISTPTVQRFCSPHSLERLLHSAFAAYIMKRPQELHFCPTPDCEQVYRITLAPSALRCPACRKAVCAACHSTGHEGQDCAWNRALRAPEDHERIMEEWLEWQEGRVKRCPKCKRLLEKAGGCNHMTCICGAHVCWTCMTAFPATEIYSHISNAHFASPVLGPGLLPHEDIDVGVGIPFDIDFEIPFGHQLDGHERRLDRRQARRGFWAGAAQVFRVRPFQAEMYREHHRGEAAAVLRRRNAGHGGCTIM